MDEIGKRDDGALLEFRYAVRFEERIEIRLDVRKAGYLAVEDVPVGRMHRERDDEYPAVRPRNRARVGVLRDRPFPVFLDDRRTPPDDGRIGGDERDPDVPVRIELSREPPCIEHQVVALGRQTLEFHLRTALDLRDVEHLRVDVVRARALAQQVRHQVG